LSDILAVASTGGHWIQLQRLGRAFEGCSVAYVTVSPKYAAEVGDAPFYPVHDLTRKNRKGAFILLFQMLGILLKERPKIVVTTGSAPGLVAIALAKSLFGARTIWIDSIANSEKLSRSGEQARRFADIWLTQWPHLSDEDGGPLFRGAVL
jgi:UDP-N-acetylglucosamine:LPS N-acetylglucosamine transferase